MIYISLWLIFLISINIIYVREFKNIKNLLSGAIITIALMLGSIRWATGTDWESYRVFYEENQVFFDFINWYQFEYGYKILVAIISGMGINYSIFLGLQTGLIIFVKYQVIKGRQYILLSFFVLYCTAFLEIFAVRQSIAVALVILAINFIVDRKFIIGYLLIFLASTFHITALVGFLVPLFLIKSKSYLIYVFCAIFIILFYFSSQMQGLLISYVVEDKLLHYISADEYRFSVLSIFYKLIIIGYLVLGLYKYEGRLSSFEVLSIKIVSMGFLVSIPLELISPVFNRISLYFTAFEFIASPAIAHMITYNAIKKKYWLLLFLFVACFALFYGIRLYGVMSNYMDLYVPFETIFHRNYKNTY